MKYIILLLILSGCTPNQATPDKYKVCEVKCKANGGTSFVKIYNESFLLFDTHTSNKFQCHCNNGAQFKGLDIKKETM